MKYTGHIFLAIAIIVGILSLINQNTFAIAAITSRFFEIMIPVLGVAALCKYLFCCKDKNSNGSCDTHHH
jgi:uncharacterized paraquat-inducible protein A